jgi:outer membrane immunogenic protein
MYGRSLLLAAALCAAPFAVASAADLSPAPAFKAPYVPPILVYNWTGFYIGGQVGGARSNANWTDPASGTGSSFSTASVIGGGQIGYNYQTGPWVFGIEGDFSGTDLRGSNIGATGFTHATDTSWASTITGRVGYAFDRTLLYVKGGVAFADERDVVTSPVNGVAASTVESVTGWTAGIGVEYALDRNWSARVEYDYLGFGSQGVPAFTAGAAAGSADLNIQRATFGVNYRF